MCLWASHITYQSLNFYSSCINREKRNYSRYFKQMEGIQYREMVTNLLAGLQEQRQAVIQIPWACIPLKLLEPPVPASPSAAELEPRDCSCCHWQTNKMATSSHLLIALEYFHQQSNQNAHVIGVKRNAAVRLWRVVQFPV